MSDKTGLRKSQSRQALEIYRRLKDEYPNTRIALDFRTPFEILVATILSAQCTDKRVNQITPALFRRFRTPDEMAEADIDEIENMIKSAGMYRTKARNLKNAAAQLRDRFGSKVPEDLESLQSLPGVGRKTANVILNNAFGIPSGIAVDTHVKRLSARLGLTSNKDPLKIEADLKQLLPKDAWIEISLMLIRHGRTICTARKPKCQACILLDICEYGKSQV
ncbi:MAG: endonuclease III [Firmicutes bacterium]|nr:endonuclease III [Bacillota bacterium]